MKARVLDGPDALRIVDDLRERGYEVVAPFAGHGRDTVFDTVTEENAGDVRLHVANPCYPPKRYVLPHIERLLHVKRREDGTLHIEPTYEEPRLALFGLRSCDVAGIVHLDRYFLGGAHRDIYYEKRRRALLVVNVVCTDPDVDIGDDCFCVCTDTGPAAREGFDLQLMDLGGTWLAVAGTPLGEALFSNPVFRPARREHVACRAALLEELRSRFRLMTGYFSAAVRAVTTGNVSEETWERIGARCFECGGCSYVCPACVCFTVSDRPVAGGEIDRVRIWDSCALSGFTRMAGGHNPRKAVHDRRNRRFFRKLAHYFVQRELSVACVGCGRCAEVCHGAIGMPTVVEMIRRARSDGETHVHASH